LCNGQACLHHIQARRAGQRGVDECVSRASPKPIHQSAAVVRRPQAEPTPGSITMTGATAGGHTSGQRHQRSAIAAVAATDDALATIGTARRASRAGPTPAGLIRAETC
jgi:hypothetical protein